MDVKQHSTKHTAFSTKCCVWLATLNQGTPGTKHAGHVRPQNYNIHSRSQFTLNFAFVALLSSLPVPRFNQNTVWQSREEARCSSLALRRPSGSCHRMSHVPCWTSPSCKVGTVCTLSVHRVPLHNCGIQASLSISLFHSGNLPALQCHFILFSCSAPVSHAVSRVTILCSSYGAASCTSLVPALLCVLVVPEHLLSHTASAGTLMQFVCLFVWCSFSTPLRYQHCAVLEHLCHSLSVSLAAVVCGATSMQPCGAAPRGS